MSGSQTIATSDTKIEALQFQSSAYGVTLPVVYGVTRIPGNLMWYGGFKAIPHTTTQSQGGKGGSVKTQQTTYTYQAAVMMGLCEGDIAGVAQVWRGKTLYQGGNAPNQILSASQNYTIPAGGGSVTVANASAYAADMGVIAPTGGGESGSQSYQMSEGYEYTRVGGTYTFPSSILDGQTVTIQYQYTQAGATQSSLQQLGLSLAKGAVGQATWSYLSTNFPAQALGYSGIAYVYASAYDLSTTASVDNHNFEVQAQLAYSISSTVPDADPSQVGYDLLTNARYGANFLASRVASTGAWSTYCRASGLVMSPALTEQTPTAEVLAQLCKLTNTALVWSEGVLKFIPYGDQSVTGNGTTYTPNTAAVYDLTDDHFLDKDNPVRLVRKPQADAYNQVQIEFLNRSNQYNVEIAEAKDQANIDTYGLRSSEVAKAHWICDASVARAVAQLLLQRALYIRNTFEFKLPWNFALLEPMDLVTLTDPTLGLVQTPVRITEVSESPDGELSFTAEEFPLGAASTVLYPTQSGAGFAHNYNVAPGSVSAPSLFEAPGALTVNGLEVYIAATGLDSNWGGCHVWVSLDGSNYKQVSTINGGSRYGALNSAATAGGSVGVTLLKGTLTSGSAADAAALNTLCFIGGATKEYFSYQTATLGGALQYVLGGAVVRGAYGTPGAAHASGDPFVRVDEAVAKSGPIDLGYIGKTIHVKLTSFNIYGGGEESLANVTDYTYSITGNFVFGNAGAQALQGINNAASDNLLTAGEKPPIIVDYTTATNEQAGIDAQATAYGISTEKTAYDNAVSALVAYMATLTAPVAWNNLSGDTNIVGATFRSYWTTLYAVRQTLLNKIAAVSGTVATWAGTSGRPTLYRVVSRGANDTGSPVDRGVYNGETGALLNIGSGIYSVGKINRSTGVFSFVGGWYVLGTAANATAMATALAAIGNDHIVVIWTWDEPQGTRLQADLATQMYRCGASKAVFGSPQFKYRSAYVLIGIPGCGEGQGFEAYQGSVDYDASAWCDVAFYVQNGMFVVSGSSATPRTLADYSYTGDLNATFGAPNGSYVGGTLAQTVESNAATALANANTAATNAASALTQLTNLASDSILSPSEKPAVVQDYAVITSEQAGIDAQATAYGITTEKTAYDNAVSALTSYLAGLSGWNTIPGSDVAIVGSTFRSNFANVYTARQVLLNKIAQIAGTQATWAGVSNRPALFRVVSRGSSDATAPVGNGLYNGETMAQLWGAARSYTMHRIRRSDGVITFNRNYDVFGAGQTGDGTAADLAGDLNASGSDSIVVVHTADEPRNNRLTSGLDTAMYRCGASRGVFGVSGTFFRFRSAYILVGIPGCGEGNGFEAYGGATDDSNNAWCDVSFYLQGGQLNISGTTSLKRIDASNATAYIDAGALSTTVIANAAVNTLYSLYDASGVGRSNAA